jgi:hypothetical protein
LGLSSGVARPWRVFVFVWPGAFLAGLIAALWFVREPTERLTPENLKAARQKWREAEITDYELEFRMQGSPCEVKVRGGVVEDIRMGGRIPTSSDWSMYTVEGLFDTLEMELEALGRTAGDGQAATQPAQMRVRFHPRVGYVERYLRSGIGPSGGASIEMIRFHACRPGD